MIYRGILSALLVLPCTLAAPAVQGEGSGHGQGHGGWGAPGISGGDSSDFNSGGAGNVGFDNSHCDNSYGGIGATTTITTCPATVSATATTTVTVNGNGGTTTLIETISSCTATTTDYETVTADGVTITSTVDAPTTTTATVTTSASTVTVPVSTATVTSTHTSTITDTTTVTHNDIETTTVTTTDTFTLEFTTTVSADGCAVTDAGSPSYGSCSDPTIIYEYGLDGRTEYSYTSNNQADFPFGSSPNIEPNAQLICNRLQSPCNAPQETVDRCWEAAEIASHFTGQEAADVWNDLMT